MQTTHRPSRSDRSLRRPVALAVAALLALTALTGCMTPPATEPELDPGAQVDEPTPDTEPEGTIAPNWPLGFTATTLDGVDVDFNTFAGRPAVLWFWAPWCSICRGEAAAVAQTAADLEGEVTFLGIAGLGELDAMQAFVAETGTGGFEHFADADGSLWLRFEVPYQPAYAFVSTDGEVDVTIGALGSVELRERTEALLD